MKTIYLAGGCFWGVEAYFKMIPGVKSTDVGYANSRLTNPSYEVVSMGLTAASETVRVDYNPKVITLQEILSFFFRIINPTLLNQQGNDVGTQYRTGVYYVDKEDEQVIRDSLKELQTKYYKPIVVEVLLLENFYKAEDYHQDYLTKNTDGYCHVNFDVLKPHERKLNKKAIYRELLSKLKVLFVETSHPLSVLSNTSALIKETFPQVSWVGFYISDGNKLVLGPFQGKVACEEIPFGKGVCGTSFKEEDVIIVPDVHEFPGHIACDSGSNSEIVLPLYDAADKLIGVLDLDSYTYDYFDEEDARYLQDVVSVVKKYITKGVI